MQHKEATKRVMNRAICSPNGFTLLELMIVIAIMGVIGAIAVPKFSTMLAKSNEGSSKGNLGALRSILSIYYSNTEGQFPSDGTASKHPQKKPCPACTTNLDALLDGGYLADI